MYAVLSGLYLHIYIGRSFHRISLLQRKVVPFAIVYFVVRSSRRINTNLPLFFFLFSLSLLCSCCNNESRRLLPTYFTLTIVREAYIIENYWKPRFLFLVVDFEQFQVNNTVQNAHVYRYFSNARQFFSLDPLSSIFFFLLICSAQRRGLLCAVLIHA
ncbi:hypothetical protein TPHA_0C03000 [Tetrapisispora phaffii CBS 4417]|uniref:Uncharacterized protein n=1 Tax=Tetrapisispora phaffii (strain ATCC 24235 / CBS 4417 / NBRC 1672 / NRRL Y-8282 / UCD 70-5) TaxID=1071381 RepID=G8BRS7_TETPH|nr:hypothetical protein TPHA_0C03000 [Tetrapisispora phaffii CBS 4417]CCE62453.1 hypothetical protein TPHA_0C03000 [Tetrapisispora phaffii CBS 4417]